MIGGKGRESPRSPRLAGLTRFGDPAFRPPRLIDPNNALRSTSAFNACNRNAEPRDKCEQDRQQSNCESRLHFVRRQSGLGDDLVKVWHSLIF